MSNQVHINGKLHDASGLDLPDREFRDFWMDPVDGVVAIDLATALPAYKAKLSKQVDDDAEEYRMNFITPGSGMILTYREKFDQAKAVEMAGQVAIDALTEEEEIASYPTLAASVGIEGATLWDVAQVVILKSEQWADRSYSIEKARLAGKAAISAGTTLDEVRAAYDAVTWGQ